MFYTTEDIYKRYEQVRPFSDSDYGEYPLARTYREAYIWLEDGNELWQANDDGDFYGFEMFDLLDLALGFDGESVDDDIEDFNIHMVKIER